MEGQEWSLKRHRGGERRVIEREREREGQRIGGEKEKESDQSAV